MMVNRMPIYEYQCGDCQHEFEALQKMADAPLTECPECQQPSLVKKVSAAGFRLAGSGWYETDFKSGKKKNLVADTTATTTKAASADKPPADKSKAIAK
jgi:putative FmdB family regulatory protein